MKMGLLLTASIDPNSMILLKVAEPGLRRQQYCESFVKWLRIEDPSLQSITLVENSGADLSDLEALITQHNRFGREVELISLDLNQFPRELGKGYGEFQMVDQAMKQSKVLGTSTMTAKVTGRLFVRNFRRIVSRLEEGLDLAGDLRTGEFPFLDTRLFFFTPSAYQRHLEGLYHKMNDSAGEIAEKVLGQVVQQTESLRVERILPAQPLWDGISGTHGISYGTVLQRMKYPYHSLRRMFRRTFRRNSR